MASNFLPAKQNFPVWKGATFRYGFQWLDDNGKEKVPHNLTGYFGEASLHCDNGEVLTLTTENGGIILGDIVLKEPANGLIEIFLPQATTVTITWTKASYVLYLQEPTLPEDRFPLLAGQFHAVSLPL